MKLHSFLSRTRFSELNKVSNFVVFGFDKQKKMVTNVSCLPLKIYITWWNDTHRRCQLSGKDSVFSPFLESYSIFTTQSAVGGYLIQILRKCIPVKCLVVIYKNYLQYSFWLFYSIEFLINFQRMKDPFAEIGHSIAT